MEDEKLKYIIDNTSDLNKQAMLEAKIRVDSLAKPLGSLGKLEYSNKACRNYRKDKKFYK